MFARHFDLVFLKPPPHSLTNVYVQIWFINNLLLNKLCRRWSVIFWERLIPSSENMIKVFFVVVSNNPLTLMQLKSEANHLGNWVWINKWVCMNFTTFIRWDCARFCALITTRSQLLQQRVLCYVGLHLCLEAKSRLVTAWFRVWCENEQQVISMHRLQHTEFSLINPHPPNLHTHTHTITDCDKWYHLYIDSGPQDLWNMCDRRSKDTKQKCTFAF